MEETTPIVEQKQGEPAVTTTEVKASPFDILETTPTFVTDQNNPAVTQTAEEIEAQKTADATKQAEETTALVEKAKGLGLPETATKEEITLAETKVADELKVKALELNLPETATKEEIEIAQKAKESSQEGFVTKDELSTGLLDAKDGTWQALMLAKGLEIPADYTEENGFELYEKAETAKWQTEIEKAKTEAQESVFAKLKPDVAAALELANSMPDMTIEQIINPTIHLDNFLKMDKEELIKADIKLFNPEYTPEMVDIKFQEIKDANQIDIKDNMIRIDINKEKAEIQNFQKQKIQEYQGRQEQAKAAEAQKQVDQINKVLDRDLTYLDKKISDLDRQYLRNKISEGYINELLSNPEKLVNAMLHDQFYTKGITSYKDRVREQVLVEQKKLLHNTPLTSTTGAAQPVVAKQPIKSGFDILD